MAYNPNSYLYNQFTPHWDCWLIGGTRQEPILSSDDEEILTIMADLEQHSLDGKLREVIRKFQIKNDLPDHKIKEILKYLDIPRYQRLSEDRIWTELQMIRLQLIQKNVDNDIEILN